MTRAGVETDPGAKAEIVVSAVSALGSGNGGPQDAGLVGCRETRHLCSGVLSTRAMYTDHLIRGYPVRRLRRTEERWEVAGKSPRASA